MMNFDDFEKKAKCIYCERPINVKHRLRTSKTTTLYKCECSLSNRFKFKDGYTFNLPVSNKYEFFIDTRKPTFEIILINKVYSDQETRKTIFETNELPDFILLPRLKLIDRLEDYLAWI